MEQVKQGTEAFNAWLDQPDDPDKLARLSVLDLAAFTEYPFSMNQTSEMADGITWYYNGDEETIEPSFALYFSVEIKNEDTAMWCLLSEFLNDRMETAGLSVYTSLRFGSKGVTMVSSGGVSVDEAVAAFRAAAAFLRTMDLAPSKLAGFKVGAVSELDSNTAWSCASAAGLAREGCTQADYAVARAAILAVTEEELKMCANELERMVA